MEPLPVFLPSGQRHCIGGPWAVGGRAVREVVCAMQVLQNPLPYSPCRTEPWQQGRQGGPRAVPGLCVGWGAPPPQWPPAQAERGVVRRQHRPPPWTVCTSVLSSRQLFWRDRSVLHPARRYCRGARRPGPGIPKASVVAAETASSHSKLPDGGHR